jgi:hypothetical protein
MDPDAATKKQAGGNVLLAGQYSESCDSPARRFVGLGE